MPLSIGGSNLLTKTMGSAAHQRNCSSFLLLSVYRQTRTRAVHDGEFRIG